MKIRDCHWVVDKFLLDSQLCETKGILIPKHLCWNQEIETLQTLETKTNPRDIINRPCASCLGTSLKQHLCNLSDTVTAYIRNRIKEKGST
jgi:hypothetical protein